MGIRIGIGISISIGTGTDAKSDDSYKVWGIVEHGNAKSDDSYTVRSKTMYSKSHPSASRRDETGIFKVLKRAPISSEGPKWTTGRTCDAEFEFRRDETRPMITLCDGVDQKKICCWSCCWAGAGSGV